MSIDSGRATSGTDQQVLRAHGYHAVRVKEVREETDDSRSFVLDIPDHLAGTYRYEPGQFVTCRVDADGEEQLRSYSMSSAPETDADLTVTVKRVPGGIVSNWLIDHVHAGDTVEITKPAGVFCLQPHETPVVAFCGGSGVTPIISIAKSALTSTDRPVRIVYANRDPESVIFAADLDGLQERYPQRFRVVHHYDSEGGFMGADRIADLARGSLDADFYICGPAAFMDLVETALIELGTPPTRIFIERFAVSQPPHLQPSPAPAGDTPTSVTIIMKGKKTTVAYQPGDTILETARRAALRPPFSCESGSCATCMAIRRSGTTTMRVNNALTPEEVEEGWILTCQAQPTSPEVTVEYESF